jgi:hypothetical protein
MEGLNDVNLKRGIDDSYSRLKTKVQKCSVDMIVMVKHLEMERHVNAQQQMY